MSENTKWRIFAIVWLSLFVAIIVWHLWSHPKMVVIDGIFEAPSDAENKHCGNFVNGKLVDDPCPPTASDKE